MLLMLLFCLGATPPVASGQTEAGSSIKIIESCYHFKFKTADSLINVMQGQNLKEAEATDLLLLKGNLLWWQIISGNDSKQLREVYYKTLYEAEKKLEAEKVHDDVYTYKGICLYGYMARMDGMNKSYVKAFFRIRNCYKYLQKSFGNEERYAYFYLSSGLYNYYMVYAGKEYPMLLPYLYFYPKGDLNKAMQHLELAANHRNKLINTEATYFLMKIYLGEKKYIQSLPYAAKLVQAYPNNGLFLYYQFYTLLRLNQVKNAQNVLAKIRSISEKNNELSIRQSGYFTQLAEKDLREERNKKRH